MAISIPIWPGSSSFFPGDTPYGFYDNDLQFQTDVERFAVWAARRLGYPITDIELQDINFYAAYEEAITEYALHVNSYAARDNLINVQGASTSSNLTQQYLQPTLGGIIRIAQQYGTEATVGGNVTLYTGSMQLRQNQQHYDLTDPNITTFEAGTPGTDRFEMRRVYHYAPPAIVRYFDPFIGTGLGSQQMLDQFGFGGFSPGVTFLMQPMYADLLRLQAIEFNDHIRKSGYSFHIVNNRIRINPIPDRDFNVYFEYYLLDEKENPLPDGHASGRIADISNIPYNNIIYSQINAIGRQWIRNYALACAMETLGYVRNKYSSLPIPNAEITMNGDTLVGNAQDMKSRLVDDLRELLDSMSRQAQLERKQAEAESLRSQLDSVPRYIFVG